MIEWECWVRIDPAWTVGPQIDTKLTPPLFDLVDYLNGVFRNLAGRNLRRS